MIHTPFHMLFEAIHRWAMHRQTLKELSALSDHALQDIGLTRQDIDPTVKDLMRNDISRRGEGRRQRVPADAGPSLSSPGLYR